MAALTLQAQLTIFPLPATDISIFRETILSAVLYAEDAIRSIYGVAGGKRLLSCTVVYHNVCRYGPLAARHKDNVSHSLLR